jgi:hypothetical protein
MAGTSTGGVPGSPTFQLVNYAEFGRCLDVTGQQPANGYLIDYPCKQAPKTSFLSWNQKWTFSGSAGGSGTLSSVADTLDGKTYCISAASSGNIVTASVCGSVSGQTWTASGVVQNNYAASYEFITAGGLCLTADPTLIGVGYSKITTAACDGTAKQKWNAPANTSNQNLTNVNEDSGAK